MATIKTTLKALENDIKQTKYEIFKLKINGETAEHNARMYDYLSQKLCELEHERSINDLPNI